MLIDAAILRDETFNEFYKKIRKIITLQKTTNYSWIIIMVKLLHISDTLIDTNRMSTGETFVHFPTHTGFPS